MIKGVMEGRELSSYQANRKRAVRADIAVMLLAGNIPCLALSENDQGMDVR